MNTPTHQKIAPHHLKRLAYLYVRQSTMRQVLENTESTKRQYGLRERAATLGWPGERLVVIDGDLGQSAASAADRAGFQQLVTDVGMGRVGIVLGLEVSRLARNSSDWHRLLEICALSQTLILDEDGLYDPCQFNDRLLLGLKGTMSEAELHVLRTRLHGGIVNKAKRGEFKLPLAVGLVYDSEGKVQLDPDAQVQATFRLFFDTFYRLRSCGGTVRLLRKQGVKFPRRPQTGPNRRELEWCDLTVRVAYGVLRNPRYAGAYFYGRSKKGAPQPTEDWTAFLPGAHPGYISWDEYERNLEILKQGRSWGTARSFAPREGPALLQGLAVCAVCGNRMLIRYHDGPVAGLRPTYTCYSRDELRHCQNIPGASIDKAVGDLLVEMMTPLALEAALTVQAELVAQTERVEKLLRQNVDRARYDADVARRRYMHVDPENRMVADSLETEWNGKLRSLEAAQAKYEADMQKQAIAVTDEQRRAVMHIATDFPRLWNLPTTTSQERKRILRLLVEDVTLRKDKEIHVHIRFRGGTTRTLTLPLPLSYFQQRKTSPAVVQLIDELLNEHTDEEIAIHLNNHGYKPAAPTGFTAVMVRFTRQTYGLPSYPERLRARGFIDTPTMKAKLGTTLTAFRRLIATGQLKGRPANSRGELWFEPGCPVPDVTTIPDSTDRFETSIETWLRQGLPVVRMFDNVLSVDDPYTGCRGAFYKRVQAMRKKLGLPDVPRGRPRNATAVDDQEPMLTARTVSTDPPALCNVTAPRRRGGANHG